MINKFTFNQVKHILYNYETYRSGDFPDSVPEELGIRVPLQARARFEAACLLAAEVGARVKRCWPDGTLVEAMFLRGDPRRDKEIATEYWLDEKQIHRLVNRVVAYCTGSDAGCPDDTDKKNWPMTYRQFKPIYNQRSDWRFAKGLRQKA